MPIGALPAAIGGLGSLIGGIAGAGGAQNNMQNSAIAGPMTGGVMNNSNGNTFGMTGAADQYAASNALNQQVNAASPYTDNANANYSQMLQQYSQTGGLPNQQQIGAANNYAQQQFAPQQAALNNTFNQASINTNRQAAALGRPISDPILQGKLAQYQGQQQQVLSGQQTALGSQVAMQLPQQQLGYAQQLNQQAMNNNNALFGYGNQMLGQAQSYSLGQRSQNTSQQSGGGLLGALGGAFGGLSGGLGLGNQLGTPGINSYANAAGPVNTNSDTYKNDFY